MNPVLRFLPLPGATPSCSLATGIGAVLRAAPLPRQRLPAHLAPARDGAVVTQRHIRELDPRNALPFKQPVLAPGSDVNRDEPGCRTTAVEALHSPRLGRVTDISSTSLNVTPAGLGLAAGLLPA
jgi:hypothetical protein